MERPNEQEQRERPRCAVCDRRAAEFVARVEAVVCLPCAGQLVLLTDDTEGDPDGK
jgi:hypothetical protein